MKNVKINSPYLFLLIAFTTGVTNNLLAADTAIVEVRRNIPLADAEPVYRDFYINAGSESGYKKNMTIKAVRRITIKDPKGSSALGEISVLVGQLKIISAQNGISVAREVKLIPRDDEPMLEQNGLMIGDLIERP